MPKPKAESEYTSNNSFMTSQVKAPKPFGDDYEDPLEALKAQTSISRNKVLTFDYNEVPEKNNDKTGLTNLTELTSLTEPTELSELSEPTGLTEPTESIKVAELIRPVINQPVSPVRDFTKTPNSIGRHVMAKGLFKGKSKQIYDFLWMSSRGSINPSRTVRKTHGEIQTGTGIGSLNTIKNGLNYLDEIGLIKKTSAVGEAWGNIYEIFTPEEVNLIDLDSPVRPVSSVSPVSQELVQPVRPVSGRTNLTQLQVESTSYGQSKTSFKDKTKTGDDEALGLFAAKLVDLARRHTGKGLDVKDVEKWAEIAEILVMEFDIAAARTKSISSVPAFLKTHLERRLFSKPRYEQKVKSRISQVGKESDLPEKNIETFVPEPLSEDARKTTLESLRQYLANGNNWIYSMSNNYTTEDWEWLMKNLEHK